jgi:hypothetical protein
MRDHLSWSQMQSGTWNGKVGPYTFFTVAWHTDDHRFFVGSKLPGQKTYPVGSVAEGRKVAQKLWQEFFYFLRE